MRIAVLGWGSLIWSPRDLAVTTRWRPGPELPVEFARQSSGGRVTLVLLDGHPVSRAYWALSAHADLAAACENLRIREGSCPPHDIHATTGNGLRPFGGGEPDPRSADASGIVDAWLEATGDVDAAVWTGLPPRGFPRLRPGDLADDVVAYLGQRRGQERAKAREYVEHAPPTIRTPVRRAVEGPPLRWSPTPLPDHLFAPNPADATSPSAIPGQSNRRPIT